MTTDLAKAREGLQTWTDVSGVEGIVVKPLTSRYLPAYRGWSVDCTNSGPRRGLRDEQPHQGETRGEDQVVPADVGQAGGPSPRRARPSGHVLDRRRPLVCRLVVTLAEDVFRHVVADRQHGPGRAERRQRRELLDRHHRAPPAMAAVCEITGRLLGNEFSR